MPRNKKYWKRRLGGTVAESAGPYVRHLDFRGIPDLDDEGLDYLLTGLKGVDMLDLNETAITNEGIRLLMRLEYVNEIRAKGCSGLDDGCVEYLNHLTSLTFLHLASTGVTLKGLMGLTRLTGLKELLFTAESIENHDAAMRQLRDQLPGCRLIVNSRPYLSG